MTIAAAALSLIVAAVAATGVWSTRAAMLFNHSEVAVAALYDKIYVVGGNIAGSFALSDVEMYDPAYNRWRGVAALPVALSHVGLAALNGKLYAVGGFSGTAQDHTGAVDSLLEYTPATDTWRALAPLSSPRGSVGVAALNGKIYAVGGRGLDIKTVAAVEVYDPARNAWTTLAPLPEARDHLAVVAVDGRIHAIGGRFGASRDNTNLHEVYDPATNTWQTAAPLPTARSSVAAAFYHGRIIVDGGECNNGKTFDQNEAYDPKTNTWSTLAPMPAGRHGFGAAVAGDVLYFSGGAIGCGGGNLTGELLTLRLP